MTWHQPLCRPCWDREHPHDLPDDTPGSEVEHCCMCGGETTDGIHALYRPAAVPYPSED